MFLETLTDLPGVGHHKKNDFGFAIVVIVVLSVIWAWLVLNLCFIFYAKVL